ncbi:MAG TPA: hypothetical protein VFP94_09975, partial [Terriglobales bacterium]|nr:hypothetical protein [Terriglobales bacterium]
MRFSNTKAWGRRHWFSVVTLFFGTLAIASPFLSSAFRGPSVNAQNASDIGDFVGGYIGTIILLISVVVLWETLVSSRDDTQRQRFEAKYFTMLK